MIVVVTGDRDWTDRAKVRKRLAELPPGTTVVVGGQRGADAITEDEALDLGFNVEVVYADWSVGRAGGPIRNGKMLDRKPDLVIAFHPDLEKSKGTADCVRQARKRNIPVEHIR